MMHIAWVAVNIPSSTHVETSNYFPILSHGFCHETPGVGSSNLHMSAPPEILVVTYGHAPLKKAAIHFSNFQFDANHCYPSPLPPSRISAPDACVYIRMIFTIYFFDDQPRTKITQGHRARHCPARPYIYGRNQPTRFFRVRLVLEFTLPKPPPVYQKKLLLFTKTFRLLSSNRLSSF
ncbi:hypothetical protein BDZ97DRAFT_182005 [Flammula alnicola]|nr:hypothetical protein BDZ97DRAFT_182005 [Flammula alnicola]